MAFPGLSLNFRLNTLKKDVLFVLRKYPHGVNIQEIWELVKKETGRTVCARDYGLSKMSRVFEKWSDNIRVSEESGNRALFLRQNKNSLQSTSEPVPGCSSVKSVEVNTHNTSEELIDLSESTEDATPSDQSFHKDPVSLDNSDNEEEQQEQQASCHLYDAILPYENTLISWILEYLNSMGGNCLLPKLRLHLKAKLNTHYDINHFSPTMAKRFLTECCSSLLTVKKVGRKFHVELLKTERYVEKSPAPKKQTAMSLMSNLSAWGKPAKPTSDFISFKEEKGGKKIEAEVIDLTSDADGNSNPSKSLAMEQSYVGPSTSKFGAFTVPSTYLKPDNSRPQTETLIETEPSGSSMSQFSAWSNRNVASFKNVVDLTIKPVVRNEFPRKMVDVRPVHVPYGRVPPRQQVEDIAKECIEILAEAYEHVTQERVDKLICQRFRCYNIRELGFNYIEQIPCVNELGRLLNKVNAYILSFVKTRSICTLHELQLALTDYALNNGDFSSLKMGPLQRFPVVFQQFRFPPDQADIPEITSMDILDHFHNYLTSHSLWQKRLELEPFMDYLVKEYEADNAYMLGVRIRSLPLLAAVLKKAQRDASQKHKDIFQHFWNTMKNDVEGAFRKFRASFLQTGEGEVMDVRRHYMKTRPEVTIMEIIDKFTVILMITQGDQKSARFRKFHKAIENFLYTMKSDGLTSTIFHLALCMSNTELEEKAAELLAPKVEDSDDDDDDDDTDDEGGHGVKSTRSKPPPRKDTLVDSLKIYIERCLNAGSLSLTHLCRIEEKLLEDFGFTSFNVMGFGRFLEFLLSDAKQLLEESGGLLLGNSSGESDTMLKPQQGEILEFIKQCQLCGLSKSAQIEDALCKQYNVKEVRHLGHGNISRLLSYADKHSKHLHAEFTVFYQSALMQSRGLPSQTESKVGILGHQTRDIAKICLHNCPLLEDLSEWSQWSLVFEPELGKLKEFIQKYGGVTTKTLEGGKLATLDFLALEVKPGELIKIVSTTSPDHVAMALESRDVQSTSGHLVSMAVAYKGVESMPLALLSSHMKTALLQIHAEESSHSSQHTAAKFVLQCLFCIPTKLCVSLANQIFIDPLGQVVGSNKSKQLLVQLCKTSVERNHLEKLGCLLGIQEWTTMIQQKFQLPDSAVQTLPPEFEELLKNNSQEEEEEEDSMIVDSYTEDVDEILEGDSVTVRKDAGNKNETDQVTDATDDNSADENSHPEFRAVKLDISVAEVGTSCEDLINQIRRDEFGVGLQLSEDGQRLMIIQQERLGRSLDRLSKDLYSKDTHFVLELIQNADDNSYHEDLLSNQKDDCPAVKFVIEHDGIHVLNNELGFREKDIKALCDVGRSTKGKHKFGYIGQKGIGFKSVFRVTDSPEVHSNGFHIKFDVNSGPTGYILPHWIPKEEWFQENEWMTRINLKLKPDMRAQTRTLAARFSDIHPSLLLFLHRLRQVTVENKMDDTTETMRRRDVGNGVVEIEHSHGCDRWLVVKKVLDARKISVQAKSGADVESTEIALGFPILPHNQRDKLQHMPPKQPVFAFLPLRSYGFRFIIQGDFDVPSSREDVDRDSSWNQWLRNEIHTVFIDALESFKSHPEYTTMEAVYTFLQFVPMEDEVLDFFKPVAADIMKKLKAKPCVPTQPNSQGLINWKIPSQTVRVRDPLIRSVITDDLLQTHMNLYYLHDDVSAMLNPALTSCLGIETLTSDHLFQLGKALISNIGTQCESDSDVVLISKWMACIYRSLDEFHHDDTVLTALRTQRILPLSDGQLVSLQDNTVFYPVPNSVERKQGKDPLYHLQKDLQSLHPKLLKTDDEEVNIQVHKLLLRLGIKQLSPFDVINHHIIPVFKSEEWKAKSEGTLVSYVVYIKEQTDKNPAVCNLDEIKDIAVVLTIHGFKHTSKEPVHFSHHYGNPVNLLETFSGYDWTLLDSVYLPELCTMSVVYGWQDFFRKLGVEEFLCVRKQDVCLKKEEWGSSLWRDKWSEWPEDVTELIIQDYTCKELEGLLLHNIYPDGSQYLDQMRQLSKYLDKHWDRKFSVCCHAHVVNKEGRVLMETDSSFSMMLKSTPWLPAARTKSIVGNNGSLHHVCEIIAEVPSNMYLKSDSVYEHLSDHVLYLDLILTSDSFHRFLDLKNSVAVETVKDFLLGWSERTESNIPATFCTSLNHMKNVYSFLGKEMRRHEFQNLLREKPVLFVPDKNAKLLRSDEIVAGKMLNRHEIWLSDKTKLFDKHRSVLEEFHSEICSKRTIESFYLDKPEILQLFKQEGKLDVQPKVEEYLELLCLLCSTSTPKEKEILFDVLHIFSVIGQAMVTPADNMPDEQTANMALESLKSTVKKKLQKQKVFPTMKDVWVSLEDNPVIVDNKDWEKMFADKPSVHYLAVDESSVGGNRKTKALTSAGSLIQTEMINVVLKECLVKKLSEVVDIRPTPLMIEPCLQLQTYFYYIVPVLQQYLKARFEDVYIQLEHINTRKMLADAKFYQTGKLEVCYWLTNQKQDTFVIRQEQCVIDPPVFYFHQDHLYSIGEINREVSSYFSQDDKSCNASLRLFLSELANIVSGETYDTLNALLQRHEADHCVVNAEEKWMIETPPVPGPEVAPAQEPDYNGTNQEQAMPCTWQQTSSSANQNDELKPLRSWPPLPSMNFDPSREKRNIDRPASSIWPPPQAKEYMRSVKNLPSTIRMVQAEAGNTTDGTNVDSGKTSETPNVISVNGEAGDSQDGDSSGPSGIGTISGQSGIGSVAGYSQTRVGPSGLHNDRKRKLIEIDLVDDGDEAVKKKGMEGQPRINESEDQSRSYNNEGPSVISEGEDQSRSYDAEGHGQMNANIVSQSRRGADANTRRPGNLIVLTQPNWQTMVTDYTYDNLGSGLDLGLVNASCFNEGQSESNIGRFGESLVAEFLSKEKSNGKIHSFRWVNEAVETGSPYDFEVYVAEENGLHSEYIEVKSTGSDNKDVFEISVQQIKFASNEKNNFHIYRVFNAGNREKVRLIRITDLHARLSTKQVKLCMLI